MGYFLGNLKNSNSFANFSESTKTGSNPFSLRKSNAISLKKIWSLWKSNFGKYILPVSPKKVASKHICPDCYGVTKKRLISSGQDSGCVFSSL